MADGRKQPAIIQMHGVSKRYAKRWVVDRVELSIHEGERIALLGHNGAGKTTLMKLMLGLCQPTRGEIVVQGRNMAAAGKRLLNIGFLPESVAFHDGMSGRENIRFYASLKRQSNKVCDELLERVGLSDNAGQRVRTYSKGMRQRLGLAQALLGNPSLMLLDEPTTGLDPALRGLFYEIIKQRAAAGFTAVISSHALTEIESSVDRVVILNEGAVVACGSLNELRCRAGLPTTIRVQVPAGGTAAVANSLHGKVDILKVNERSVVLNCVEQQKMNVLRHLVSLDKSILDVDITPVKLEQLYEYFTTGQRTVE